MTQRDSIVSGKRLSFSKLVSEYNIKIPIIQRDFAQGRKKETEVRDAFILALYNYLKDNINNRDLDFIYGNQLVDESKIAESPVFTPIDGQQRLTTLFLLHWYLANKDGKVKKLQDLLLYKNKNGNFLSKFSYETRASSKEFCDALIKNEINFHDLLPPDEEKNNSLSKTVKDSTWFFLSWNSDPTVQAMLVMLDALHNSNFKESSGFFERLINDEDPIITFLFLDLKEFNLTDDLYIKMNSRGVPLTPYENFKAKLLKYINTSSFKDLEYSTEFSSSMKIGDYLGHRIDTDWTNLFWQHSFNEKGNRVSTKVDKIIMHFISAFIINQFAGIGNNESVKELIDRSENGISFQQYNGFKCFNKELIRNLITVLDILSNVEVESFINTFYYNQRLSFRDIINHKSSRGRLSYLDRIQFHAFTCYLIQWEEEGVFNDLEGLKNWMRIIHNLSENTIYNNEEEFIRSIKGINKLIKSSNDIINLLAEDKVVEGFYGPQTKEERIKAHLIIKSQEWKDSILEIEQHPYFKGQIGFLFQFSKLWKYYEKNNHCNWSKNEDDIFITSFINYARKSRALFNANGVKDFDDYLWERTLLSKGDYMLPSRRNFSFLNNGFDRDISWKRLLRISDKNKEYIETRRNYIKTVFDDTDFNISNLEKSLKKIKSKSTYSSIDWQFYFINMPQLYQCLDSNKKYIRYGENGQRYLLSKQKISAQHFELKTYVFYLEHMKGKIFSPFLETNYFTNSGAYEEPCAYLYNWEYNEEKYELDVYYDYEDKKYELRFQNYDTQTYPDELIKILEQNQFEKIEESHYYNFYLDENEVISKIELLCQALLRL